MDKTQLPKCYLGVNSAEALLIANGYSVWSDNIGKTNISTLISCPIVQYFSSLTER